MSFVMDERPSDSLFVEQIWRTHSAEPGSFISVADQHWEMVITRFEGGIGVSLVGPMTKAELHSFGGGYEWLGIRFRVGTFMPRLPALHRVDTSAILPMSAGRSFLLDGSTWELPTFENVDTFVQRLVRAGIVAREPMIEHALQSEHGAQGSRSARSLQRRFRYTTGITQSAIHQITRAQHAVRLLQSGSSILDTVYEAGYADQPHLTRALRHLVGQTPTEIATLVDIRSGE